MKSEETVSWGHPLQPPMSAQIDDTARGSTYPSDYTTRTPSVSLE